MARITTLTGMRNYIKKMLGNPVINVEVDDDQFDQVIDDTIQIMNRYNYGDGSYLDYAIFTTTADQSEYTLSANYGYGDVEEMYDFYLSLGTNGSTYNGINSLFTPTHILLQEVQNHQGMFGTNPYNYGSVQPGLEMTSYQIAMMYLETINELIGKIYTVQWRSQRNVLHITPTPQAAYTGILAFYRRETAANLYNHVLVKKLAVAKAKILWGNHLRKYSIQMPGGGTINGSEIIQEGKEEEREAMESIRFESNPTDFFIG